MKKITEIALIILVTMSYIFVGVDNEDMFNNRNLDLSEDTQEIKTLYRHILAD